ncbi:MAG: Nif3-like dinuclear metal center hexameric protein, partial [Microbacteriaceae bacterium]|nr:Nif3-like dinuclear metal center hexameric protein [Microbacteriaceae bacterium]
AQQLELQDLEPLDPSDNGDGGIGRVGNLPQPLSLADFAAKCAQVFPATAAGLRVAGDPAQQISRVALCGGAGDSLLDNSLVKTADVYVTSDLRHHAAQEFLEQGRLRNSPALIDVAHWAAESLWLETAAAQLREELPEIEFVVSKINTDPWNFTV